MIIVMEKKFQIVHAKAIVEKLPNLLKSAPQITLRPTENQRHLIFVNILYKD